MQVLTSTEQTFVRLKKEFDEYEKNKLIKEKLEVSIESFNMKIEKLNDKLTKYEQAQEKIQANNKIDELLIKADIRLNDLETEKNSINKKMTGYQFEIDSLNEKIVNNKKLIEKIKEESSKERVYKVYLETFGKNGISKLIMKTMMPLINSELQRLLEDSCHFRLEVRMRIFSPVAKSEAIAHSIAVFSLLSF